MSGSSIFDNCSFHFSFEKDYEQCTNATNPCQLIEDMAESRSIRLWMGFYIPSVICFLAVLIDIYCLGITVYLLRKLNEETRKRYVFVFIRLSSAILVAICIVFFQSTYFSDAIFSDSFAVYAIFFVIYDFSLFSLLGSFTGVAIMTYFGIMRPIVYRDKLSIRGMYWIAAGIWIGSAVLSIPIGLFQAADNVDGPIKCESESCQLIVRWLLFSISCIILISATSTLLFVTISLYWHNYKSKKWET
uniref:G_PROTEIN_RECEP_F1_2 domain-containing protein n=1 Tax=Caenorhabditis tropicalis TaxID=1561998 RepID=A0A1I7TB37_9PELO